MNEFELRETGAARDQAGSPVLLREGERLDDLQLKGLKIIQRKDAFRFGTDSVLLADFAAPRKDDLVADFGAGTGALPLLMAGHRDGAIFDAIEIQPDVADMLSRSVALNGLESRIRVHRMDLRAAAAKLGYAKHTLVVCNPPYSPEGAALPSDTEAKRIARHEGAITIGEIAGSAAKLLKNGGRIALIYPAPRALELMCALKEHRLEPKRVRIIQDKPGAAPKLILLDAVKGAGSMLHWLSPLVLRDEDGEWSAEWKRIYRV